METTVEFEIDKHICHLISLLGQLNNSKQINDTNSQPMSLSNIATKLKETAFLKLDENIHDFEQCIKMVVTLKMMAAAEEAHDNESFKNYQNELKQLL